MNLSASELKYVIEESVKHIFHSFLRTRVDRYLDIMERSVLVQERNMDIVMKQFYGTTKHEDS